MVLDDLVRTAVDASSVYRKSGLGAAQLAHGRDLSPRERHVLILLDGRRTIAELSDLFGAETVQRVVPELEAKGFTRRVDPAPADEWANAITQLYVGEPPAESARRAPAPSPDWNPAIWMTLLAVVTIVGGYWAADRYRSQADAAWQRDQAVVLAQVWPGDAKGAATSSDAIDTRAPERLTHGNITPITRLPVVIGLTTAPAIAPEPERTAPPAVARDPKAAAVRTGLRAVATVKATVPRASSPPVAELATPATKVDLPAVTVATVADAPAAPAASPGPIAAPALIATADLPAGEPRAEVAMQSPVEQPTASLRPLRHDPPQFPERALRDGIVESQVRVRLWVTPEGKVDQVDILQAAQPGLFDDEVRRALSLWTFEPPGQPIDQIVDLTLKP
jgi:TonB family protein